jgi:hypothetical protein
MPICQPGAGVVAAEMPKGHFVARKFRLCRSERGFLIDPGWAIVE